MTLIAITDRLADDLERLRFSAPVSRVYNPLVYAREPLHRYLSRYGGGRKEALFLGMNPGPWGMAQTGVPFGEVAMVRDWLGITGAVGKPGAEHPRKRVEGFSCRRSEVSGKRLWGLFRERFVEPDRFFARFFVYNYCPLLFLDRDGRNITPDRLAAKDREPLVALCDRALREVVACLGPRRVIGVGAFAAARAATALAGLPVAVGKIHHPSPANPAANRGWQEIVAAELRAQGIEL